MFEIVGHIHVSFTNHDMYLVDFDYVIEGEMAGHVSHYVSGQMWDSHLAGKPVLVNLVRGYLEDELTEPRQIV